MRVLITPMAWPTHYYQMVGVAWALRAAGHEVRVAGQPPVLEAVTQTGVMAVSVGGGYDMMAGVADIVRARNELAPPGGADGPGGFPPGVAEKLLQIRMIPHIKAAEDMAADLVEFARKWRPEIVIADPLVYAAPLAAAAVGAPLVRHLWGPDMSRHVGLPGTGVGEEEDPRAAWPQGLVALYERYGAKPQADVAVRTLDTCPASVQLPGVPHRIPLRYTSYNGAAVAPSWLLDEPERPRVCVTWGSSSTTLVGPEAFAVPRILEALADLDIEVVVAIRATDRSRIPHVPAGARVIEGMPLDLILPGCQAVIHQSGAGTMLSAAYYGVPQVTIPQVADQELVSERLAGTGAGIGLLADQADVDGIRAAASAVLSGSAPIAAARLREEMLAQPPAAAIIAVLEDLV